MSNSSSSATKLSTKTVVEEAKRLADKNKSQEKQNSDVSDKHIELTKTNAFAQIMLNPSLSPEAKRDEMVKVLTFVKEATKESSNKKYDRFQQTNCTYSWEYSRRLIQKIH